MPYTQLAYVSKAIDPFSQEQLCELLKVAREHNTAADLTGMLLYKNGEFLQVIEGPQQQAHALFDKIKRDRRHYALSLLAVKQVAHRTFADWTMGFENLDDPEAPLPAGFNDFLLKEPFSSSYYLDDPESAFATLEMFRLAHAQVA